MSPAQSILLNLDPIILFVIIVMGSVVLSIGGLMVTHFFYPVNKIKLHNDVAGYIFASLGAIYAVLLAFMVVVSWQQFDTTNKNVVKEANYIASIYRDSEAFAPAFRTKVRASLDEYVNAVVNDEWPMLAKGERSMKVQKISDGIWRLFGGYQPRSEAERIFFTESVQKLNSEGELRRERILDSQSGIPGVLWTVLIAGGLVTIVFTLFFGTENFGAQMVMTALLAMMISSILYTIFVFDFPFTGSVTVSPAEFKIVLQNLAKF